MPRSLKICTAAGDSAVGNENLGHGHATSSHLCSSSPGLCAATPLGMALRSILIGMAGARPGHDGCMGTSEAHAAFGSASLASAKAQSSHGVSASRSAGLDRGAAPDAQARRRVAIGADVVGDALLLQRGGDLLRERRLRVGRQRRNRGIDDLEAHRGVRADRRVARRGSRSTACARPSRAIALGLASARAISALRPPTDFAHSARRDSPRRTASTAC